MRIALRVNVAQLTGKHGRDFQRGNAVRRHDASGRSPEDLRIARAVRHFVGPQFERKTVLDEQCRIAGLLHQNRSGRHEVRVLIASGQRRDLDAVTANLLGQRFECRQSANNSQLLALSYSRGRQKHCKEKSNHYFGK